MTSIIHKGPPYAILYVNIGLASLACIAVLTFNIRPLINDLTRTTLKNIDDIGFMTWF